MKRCYGCMKEFDDEFELCPHCGFIIGTMPELKSQLPCGTKLANGRYILGKVLGHGGFGITYIAWDNKRQRPVAVKEFFPNALTTRGEGETSVSCYNEKSLLYFKEGVKKMLDEGERLSRFYKNENIVNVYDHFEANKTAYIVMEYLEGIDLKHYLKENGGKLDAEEAVEITLAVLNALIGMHSENIIHRDISPDNIFICNNGKVKLLDFGSARLAVDDSEKSLSVMVKRGYAPKEQYASRSKQGPWTDIYAVCATLYEMITGHRPVESTERDTQLLKTFKEYGVLGRGRLEEIIAQGLEPEIENRIQDADVLYLELSEIINREAVRPDIKLRNPAPKPEKNKKKPWIIATACVLAVLACAVGALALKDKAPVPDKETTTASSTVSETEKSTAVMNYPASVSKSKPVDFGEKTRLEYLSTEVLKENENVYMADINADEKSEIVVFDENGVSAYTTLADGSMTKCTLNCAKDAAVYADTANNALVIVDKGTNSQGKLCYQAFNLTVSADGLSLADKVRVSEDDIEGAATGGAILAGVQKKFNSKYARFTEGLTLTDLKTLNVSGSCGSNSKWILHRGGKLLRIYGRGNAEILDPSEGSWNEFAAEIGEIIIGDSIFSIGDKSFSNFTELKEVHIGQVVVRIGDGAFEGCTKLSELKLPDSVEEIGSGMIKSAGVKSVTVGKLLKTVNGGAFTCEALEKITVSEENRYLDSDESGILYSEGMASLLCFPANAPVKSLTLNGNTVRIAESAFYSAKQLEEIILHENIAGIGANAFFDAVSLKNVAVSGSVKIIENNAFSGCTSLESVILKEGITEISAGAFSGCSALKAISLPSTLNKIGAQAFAGCTGIKSLNMPSSVSSVDKTSFSGWTSAQTINVGIRQASNWQQGWSAKANISYKF